MERLTKVIFFLIFFPFSVTASSDTLRQGDRLNSSSFLFSANQLFKLGFFTAEKYSGYYLAIWYNSDLYTRPVWIGNRDTECLAADCVLAIDGAGNLIITDNVGKPIELYSASSGINTTATLLNTGNLIVREVKSNESVLWQSFDYPSDTFLPGMKLGVNHGTRKNWTLTSWRNGEAGVSGAFTMEWDPIGRRLMVRRRGKNFWTTGVLKDEGFEFLDTYSYDITYKFRNIMSEDEECLSFSLRYEERRSSISGWRLDDEGSIDELSGREISDGSLCYGYENYINKGCQLWQQPECRNQDQSFRKRSGMMGPGAQQTYRFGNLSFSDCKADCWDDCACFGFQFDVNTTSCTFYRGNQSQFDQDLSGDSPQIYLINDRPEQSTTDAPSFHVHSGRRWIWIVIPAVGAFILLVFGCLWCLRRRKIKLNGRHDDVTDEYMDSSDLENGENKSNNLRVLNFQDISVATNDFSPKNELGKGGFGCVYKGKLLDGTEIAIKRLSERSSQGVEEFKNELKLIANLQHVNLVRLLGCCIHGDEKMLIYEHMPNKSLDYFLFDPTRKEQLTWQKRFSLIEGIAQGLLYLHKYSRLKIIHRDLKASNILLDEQMNPKISDFGMARIFKQNVLEANTRRVVGTYGYMAPEYAMKGMFSIKSDVFSFGVVILEIVSGQRTNSFHQIDGPLTLMEHAWELWNKDAALELMDPMLTHSCPKQLLRCIHVALLCVQDRAVDRPTILDVISMLTNDFIALPLPKKPAFVFGERVDEGGSNKSMLEKCSVNELSCSLEVPR